MRHSWAFGALKEIAIRLLELTVVELRFHWDTVVTKCHRSIGHAVSQYWDRK